MRALLVGSLATAAMVVVACGSDVSAKPRAAIESFRQAAAVGDAQTISKWVRYPLKRSYPLAPVRSAQECVARFAELFPKSLLADVVASKEEDWQAIGWRGVQFGNGQIWLDDQQRLRALNDSSPAELAHRSAIIERDRNSLAPSLQGYDEPVLRWQTETYRVRVDRMEDGVLRYTSWRRAAALDAAAELQLLGGVHEFDGSGGNQHYEWRSGAHCYRLEITLLGSDESVPFELVVRRGDDLLLAEPATIFYPR